MSKSTRSIACQQPRTNLWDDTDDDVDVESLRSKSTKLIVKQQKQPSKPISFSSYIERHAAASAKLQDDNASRATSNTSPGSEADTEVSHIRSIAARDPKRDEPLKKSTFFGKSTKTVPCRYFFKTGYCHFDERCSFHHNEGEQTELYKKLWKTVDLAVKKGDFLPCNAMRALTTCRQPLQRLATPSGTVHDRSSTPSRSYSCEIRRPCLELSNTSCSGECENTQMLHLLIGT